MTRHGWRWHPVAGALLLAACSAGTPEMTPAPNGAPPAAATSGTPPLAGTRWILTRLGTRTVLPVDGDRAAHLIFEAREQRVSGSSGCNRITGSYTIEGSMLRFGPTAGTRMACSSQLMEQEQAFFNALEATNGYRIVEGQLELRDGDRQLVAKFRGEG